MSRVIFSIIPHGWELRVTQRIKPKKVLASYFYLKPMKEEKIREFFESMRAQGTQTLIDSGVFSLRIKYGKGIFQLGSSHERFSDAEKNKIIEHYRNHIDDFNQFKDEYAEFLGKWGEYLDYAIDLDVDQFLGLDTAEDYYHDLIKKFPSKRLLRVWHGSYRTFDDWVRWCDSGDFTYLAMEGAGSHQYNPHFYDRFVEYAHTKGVIVHILAMTSETLLQQVAFDTGDSTTYQVGARFGQIQTPWGFIYLSEVGKDKANKTNYFLLPEYEQLKIRELVEKGGFDINLMLESAHEKKSAAGIERSAWNMYFQENYFGSVEAANEPKQLKLF